MRNSSISILLPDGKLWSPAHELLKALPNRSTLAWNLADPIARQNRFIKRINSLRLATHQCLVTDNRLTDFEIAEQAAMLELGMVPGQYVIASADLIMGGFPPKGLELEYRTLVQAVGMQLPVGAWSIIQMDLLTLAEDKDYIFTDVIPELVTTHPKTVLNTALSEAQFLQYKGFFIDAATYLKSRVDKLQAELNGSQDQQQIENAALLIILTRAFAVYTAIEWFADKSIEIMKRQEAAARQAQLKKEADEYEEKVRRDFQPMPNADRWLDQLEKFNRWKTTG